MNNSYSHNGFIQYNVDVSLQADILEITLTITQKKKVKTFKNLLIDDSLPTEIKKEFKTVKNLFAILEEEGNFKVDPLRGQIIVLLKKMEREGEIKLNFVGEEEKKEMVGMESNIYEEFGGEISEMEFP